MEPSDDHIDLDWLTRAIRLAEKHHIAVVIGHPTDAPPAWLTTKYPDTLSSDANGHLRESTATAASSPIQAPTTDSSASASLPARATLRPRPQRHRLASRSATSTPMSPSTPPRAPSFKASSTLNTRPVLAALNRPWATAYWSGNLRPLGRDPAQLRRQQPWPHARSSPLRHRNLAQLPARTACGHPPPQRSPSVHHHQHRRPRMVR